MAKTLKEMVGKNLQIDLLAAEFRVTNGAGFASYDAQGYRTTVNGIPEYFPETITVSGWDSIQAKPNEISVKLTLDTSDFDEKLVKINELISSTDAIHSSAMRIGVNTTSDSDEEKRIKKLVIDNVTEQITKMLQPGGLLSRR